MDTYLFILLCTLSIAIIGGIGAFLLQLLLSRDKQLHQSAHLKALEKESEILEKLRAQQENSQHFSAHYKILTKNKKAIQSIDRKIDALFDKKLQMIHSYGEMVHQSATSMIKEFNPFSQKKKSASLKEHFAKSFQLYEAELEALQKRRASLWDIRADFQKNLLDEEKARNKKLDDLYSRHTDLFEKVYLSQIKSAEMIDKASIDAGKQAFEYSILSPVRLFEFFFSGAKRADLLKQTTEEMLAREVIRETEGQINSDTAFNLDEDALSISSV